MHKLAVCGEYFCSMKNAKSRLLSASCNTLARFSALLVLLISFTGSYAQTATTVYAYEIKLEEQYRDKSLLDLIAPADRFIFRSVTGDGFRLKTSKSVPVSELEDVLLSYFIPFDTIIVEKEYHIAISDEKAGGKDCEQAQLLCSNTTQTANSNGDGDEELDDDNSGCLSSEHQSSWYYLNVQTGGNLTFTIDPQDNRDDYDFAVWGPFTPANAGANCPPVNSPIRCNYSRFTSNTGLSTTAANTSEGQNGDRYSKHISATAGQIYILLVDNYSNSGDPYSLSFGNGGAVLGCTPVVLPVELSDFSGVSTTEGNLISWTTQSEHASENFRVEWTNRPQDGNWETVATKKAAGNSDKASSYHILDQQKRNGINYYRLVQTDTDGTEHIFNDFMIAIDNSKDDPQPVKALNLLGQKVEDDAKGLVLLQFENGHTIKIYR